MRQLFVNFDPPVAGYDECLASLNDAYRSGDSLHVTGVREGVDVAFELKVQSILQRDLGLRKLLEFSGVTEPELIPYQADYDETKGHIPIELRIHTDLTD
jgi:hypothetical protein